MADVGAEVLALRAYRFTLNPLSNPLKQTMDNYDSVATTPPMLGIFNDIPWFQLRESDVEAWARAGFTWVVNDGEHRQWEGRYSEEKNRLLLRYGILPVQRLHREARSEHGDALQLGSRATMRPYGSTIEDAEDYFKTVSFPDPGSATALDRGAYPPTAGGLKAFTPSGLREVEKDTQAFLQFETEQYILDKSLQARVLQLAQAQGRNKACGFVGPFDAILRNKDGEAEKINAGISSLFQAAAKAGVHMGRVVGSGTMTEPAAIEQAMANAMKGGCRLITCHQFTSALAYEGAAHVAAPFFRAAESCGFSRSAASGCDALHQWASEREEFARPPGPSNAGL